MIENEKNYFLVININVLMFDSLYDLNRRYDHILSAVYLMVLVPLIRPVLLAAMRPTF